MVRKAAKLRNVTPVREICMMISFRLGKYSVLDLFVWGGVSSAGEVGMPQPSDSFKLNERHERDLII
ncbi:hypothetical protein Astex_0830 [Asticcacaulis excentricus CB 48]|uniref:Uncharacterized protein n=1 Tax=Asticcacaulis excentricus (strain ATCC 15261 / DSM 4724 / KCTC 12464 / NCIMB 9791 / VKM B-1370 / CB 48) TaxID=573065 RepID=E8RKV3_ASTEC|nr:hypothetical protein Astex_0830 [Asticcacaulis excentricus CB 48]